MIESLIHLCEMVLLKQGIRGNGPEDVFHAKNIHQGQNAQHVQYRNLKGESRRK